MHPGFGGLAWSDRTFHLRSTKTAAVLASGLPLEPASSPLPDHRSPGKVALRRWGAPGGTRLEKLGWLRFSHWGKRVVDVLESRFVIWTLLSSDWDVTRPKQKILWCWWCFSKVCFPCSMWMNLFCLLQEKNKAARVTPSNNPDDPFNDEERERLQVEALAKKFEDKYVGHVIWTPSQC